MSLNYKVLVLNRNWQAVYIATLKRAISLIYGEYGDLFKARIVEHASNHEVIEWLDWIHIPPKPNEKFIRTPNLLIRVPQIIVLQNYDKIPRENKNFSREALYKRDQYTCQYCGEGLFPSECTNDHLVPKSKGGGTAWENCVTSCGKCNSQKGNNLLQNTIRPKRATDYHRINNPSGWKGPSPMKLLKQPKPPAYSLKLDGVCLESWKPFIKR